MKLHEIIEMNEDPNQTILIENMLPYKKMLNIYFSRKFTTDPMLMVTDVMNAVQYAKIVPAGEFSVSICAYMDVPSVVEDENEEGFNADEFAEYEDICFNSILLKDL